MTITQIETVGKGRYRIYIDGEVAFILYRTELKKLGIEENGEISSEVITYIKTDVLSRRAKLRAMNLLMQHSFTESRLREKLQNGDYPQDIIDEALEYVKSYGYVDDRAFCIDYVRSHQTTKSIARLRNDLLTKGIDKQIIDTVLHEINESSEPVDEMEQIQKLLLKKHFIPEEASYEEKQKIFAFLMRKGYSAEHVKNAIKSYEID